MNGLSLVAAFVSATMGCCAAAQPIETTKSVDAVIAVEHHWTQAEVHGDAAYVSDLLLPQYESVDADGTANPKSAIVASAVRNGKSDKMARLVARYTIEHPYGTLVHIQGDTAVVTFYALKRGPKKGVQSTDIFVYVSGRWHAAYSQHTQVTA